MTLSKDPRKKWGPIIAIHPPPPYMPNGYVPRSYEWGSQWCPPTRHELQSHLCFSAARKLRHRHSKKKQILPLFLRFAIAPLQQIIIHNEMQNNSILAYNTSHLSLRSTFPSCIQQKQKSFTWLTKPLGREGVEATSPRQTGRRPTAPELAAGGRAGGSGKPRTQGLTTGFTP